jgi:hypothetical protein
MWRELPSSIRVRNRYLVGDKLEWRRYERPTLKPTRLPAWNVGRLRDGELHVTRMLFVVAIALAQPSWISVHAADVSAEAKAAVEEAITELGCSMDVGDEIEANGDGYKAEYVLCADGPYYLTFDKDYKLTGKEKQD